MNDINNILNEMQIQQVLECSMKDPFALLGMFQEEKGISIRTVQHGAVSVKVRNQGGKKILCTMNRIEGSAIFTCAFPRRKKLFRYELILEYHDGSEQVILDPYSFLPVLTEEDTYLFNEGKHHYIFDKMGAHPCEIDEVKGTHFAVWAPSAQRVSVVGAFNTWDGRCHPMRMLGSSGIWELFIPDVHEGEVYKFEIKKAGTSHLVLKTDPYGYRQEPFPNHGSIVTNIDGFKWEDSKWIDARKKSDTHSTPMSIYELHLGSWKKSGPDEDGDYLTYLEIAEQLVDYMKEMGYTHVELMLVQEHPYVPPWG